MLSNKKGFTLGEAIASVIALGVISMTVQSLLLVSSQFLDQQKVSFSALEEKVGFHHLACNQFQHPMFVASNPERSFRKSIDSSGKTEYAKIGGNLPKATLSLIPFLTNATNVAEMIDFTSLGVSKHDAVSTFLGDIDGDDDNSTVSEQSGVNVSGEEQLPFKFHLKDTTVNFDDLNTSGSNSTQALFYDIYSDSHTLTAFQISHSDGSNPIAPLGMIEQEGTIFATRCIKNEILPDPLPDPAPENGDIVGNFISITGDSPAYSIIDNFDEGGFSLVSGIPDPKEVTASALYVLEQKIRPFYFPRDGVPNENQIKCCDIGTSGPFTEGSCSNLEEFTPVTYAINFKTQTALRSGGDPHLDIADDNLKGFTQNQIDDLNNDVDTFTQTIGVDGCKDTNDKFEFNSSTCQSAARKMYYTELSKKFTFPVSFTKIIELPLNKKNRASTWAYAFIAPYSGEQDMTVDLQMIHVENNCHNIMPQHICAKVIPGMNLAETIVPNDSDSGLKNSINGKSAADYFNIASNECSFTYQTPENNAFYIPMGVSTQ